MKVPDPRLWGIQNPRKVLLGFLCLTLLFGWGNVRARKGGILDGDAILNPADPMRNMDRYVTNKVPEGFEGREMIPFILTFPNGIQTPADLQKIWHFSQQVKAVFGHQVVSLAEIPDYQDTGEALLDEPYITPALFTNDPLNLATWKERVKQDPTVYGLLIGRNFDWAAVVRFLPPGYDEIIEFRRTVEFLEGRPIPWWEWLWKTDIFPQDPDILVGSWCIGRGIIDQACTIDTILLVSLGTRCRVRLLSRCHCPACSPSLMWKCTHFAATGARATQQKDCCFPGAVGHGLCLVGHSISPSTNSLDRRGDNRHSVYKCYPAHLSRPLSHYIQSSIGIRRRHLGA